MSDQKPTKYELSVIGRDFEQAVKNVFYDDSELGEEIRGKVKANVSKFEIAKLTAQDLAVNADYFRRKASVWQGKRPSDAFEPIVPALLSFYEATAALMIKAVDVEGAQLCVDQTKKTEQVSQAFEKQGCHALARIYAPK